MKRIVLLCLTGGCGTEHSLGTQRPADTDTDSVAVSCVDQIVHLDEALALHPGASAPEHPDSARDAAGLWVVYSDQGEVFGLHLGCDGSVDLGPTALENGREPTLAVSGARMLLAWTEGDSVRHRVYTTSGQSVSEAVTLPSVSAQPTLASLGEAGFALAAGQQLDGAEVEVFVQRIDFDGQPVGAPVFVDPRTGWLQYEPTVAAYSGTLWTAWTEFQSGERRVRRGTLFPGDDTVSSRVTVDPSGSLPQGSASSGGAWFAYESAGVGGQAVKVKATHGSAFEVGEDGVDDVRPTVAAGVDGGAVAWVQDEGLWVARFSGDGTLRQQRVVDDRLSSERLELVHLQDDTYWLAFVAGAPAQLYGRFILF